uniref:Uncharacterized protein n=1 Tax=Cacopsylla melanoneura TaxID=428564 RepID=A0A8D8XHL8_9HEMI
MEPQPRFRMPTTYMAHRREPNTKIDYMMDILTISARNDHKTIHPKLLKDLLLYFQTDPDYDNTYLSDSLTPLLPTLLTHRDPTVVEEVGTDYDNTYLTYTTVTMVTHSQRSYRC